MQGKRNHQYWDKYQNSNLKKKKIKIKKKVKKDKNDKGGRKALLI